MRQGAAEWPVGGEHVQKPNIFRQSNEENSPLWEKDEDHRPRSYMRPDI